MRALIFALAFCWLALWLLSPPFVAIMFFTR